MKIERLHDNASLTVVRERINEIIDLLNNSFITQDPDTIYGSVTDSLPTERLTTISSDRLTPLENETTCELTVDHLMNMVEGAGGIYDNIKCPKCGAKHFEIGPCYCTAVNYPTIIKEGVKVNSDHNRFVTTYTCCECGHRWEE